MKTIQIGLVSIVRATSSTQRDADEGMKESGTADILQVPSAWDRTALAAVYDCTYEPLYGYIYRQVSDMETARDLTADVFTRFLQAVEQGNGPDDHVKAWLYRTAHNIVVDHYRRQQHRRHLPLEEELLQGDADPAGSASVNLESERARTALQALTDEQQEVIILKYLEGLSNAEVAEVVEKSIGAIKALQHRGLAALRRELEAAKEKVSP